MWSFSLASAVSRMRETRSPGSKPQMKTKTANGFWGQSGVRFRRRSFHPPRSKESIEVDMASNTTLDQLGLSPATHEGAGGTASSRDIAAEAICRLVESGKVSMADAQAAVAAAKGTNRRSKKARKESSSPPGVHRTRHVALKFSYDGTAFSGFAENVGTEGDNSIEKALFAALEKTRLLVSPEENGAFVLNKQTQKSSNQEGESEEGHEKEKAISARTAAQYSRCGRTDKGVHAHGQVIAMYLKSAFPLSAKAVVTGSGDSKCQGEDLHEESLPKNSLDKMECFVLPRKKKRGNAQAELSSHQLRTISEYDYAKVLNNVLPSSIRVIGWCPVTPKFSARFSCSRRTYRYFFPKRDLNLDALAQGLKYMIGRHDFRNLCKMNCEQVYNFERVIMSGAVVSPQRTFTLAQDPADSTVRLRVHKLDIVAKESPHDICHVQIEGQAFLWHQIRCIMSILFLVGRELENPSIVRDLLDVKANPAKPAYDMASETALVLHDCKFNRLNPGHTVCNLWNVTKILETRWETHAVAAARANDELESIKVNAQVQWDDVVQFVMSVARERRRKEQKRTNLQSNDEAEVMVALDGAKPSTGSISWGNAVSIVERALGIHPHNPSGVNQRPKGLTESSVHVPLMDRSKGTTYEEKVKSILDDTNGKARSKRRDRYEENVIKKRKTSEEDKAFYDEMLKQGGSSL